MYYWKKVILLALLLPAGCIGTDLVDDLLGPDLSRVEISETAIDLLVAEDYQLRAIYYDILGQEASETFIWESDDLAVAAVDGTGLVTGVAPGQTQVYATASSGRFDSVLVTIVDDVNAVAAVELSATSGIVAPGSILRVEAVVRNTEGQELNGIPLSWRSSDPAVASVDDQGWVTGLSEGTTQITASAEGIRSAALEIRVGVATVAGSFVGRNGYSASGAVTAGTDGSGTFVRLESDFQTQSGPGLHVYLSQSGMRAEDFVDLGELKATTGTQVYEVPVGVDPIDFSHVLIYCKPFSVVFASAQLE